MGGKRLTAIEQEYAIELYKKNISRSEIARRLGVHPATIGDLMNRRGIEVQHPKLARPQKKKKETISPTEEKTPPVENNTDVLQTAIEAGIKAGNEIVGQGYYAIQMLDALERTLFDENELTLFEKGNSLKLNTKYLSFYAKLIWQEKYETELKRLKENKDA